MCEEHKYRWEGQCERVVRCELRGSKKENEKDSAIRTGGVNIAVAGGSRIGPARLAWQTFSSSGRISKTERAMPLSDSDAGGWHRWPTSLSTPPFLHTGRTDVSGTCATHSITCSHFNFTCGISESAQLEIADRVNVRSSLTSPPADHDQKGEGDGGWKYLVRSFRRYLIVFK